MDKIEEYFKDLIDWKFYSYLREKLTPYEDMGIKAEICVCVKTGKYHTWIYGSHVNDFNRNNLAGWEVFGAHRTHGLYYTVFIYDDEGNEIKDITEEYYQKIKNKVLRFPGDGILNLVLKHRDSD